MKRFAFVLLACFVFMPTLSRALTSILPELAPGETRLLRFPTVSDTRIAFIYAGDIYTVPIEGGNAVKLTNHPGYASFPKFSPDGREIAFTALYDGNTEVYTIPAGGGAPRRLTYTATVGRDMVGERMGPNNIVMAWTPDGKEVIYRGKWEAFSGLKANLYRVAREGGPSEMLPLAEGGFCCFSPDGKQLAFNRMFREFRTWKYYRGGQADDIWITNLKNNNLQRITEGDSQEVFPMWIGSEIYFCSDRERIMNLYVYNTKTRETSQVTNFTEYDVKFPSCNAGRIVFENGGYIYVLDAATKECRRVPITVVNDVPYARDRRIDAFAQASHYDLSPKGDRVLVTARGEIFNLAAQNGITYNLTQTPGVNERDGSWSPDGRYIAYIGDATGENEIYIADPVSGKATRLTDGPRPYIYNIEWTPDSKSIIYSDITGRLVQVSLDKREKELVKHKKGRIRGFDISADGTWMAYTLPEENETEVVWIQHLASGKTIRITDRWNDSSIPVFSEDGKYLYFVGSRYGRPTYARNEWNAVYGSMPRQIFMVLLAKDTPNPLAMAENGRSDKASVNKGKAGEEKAAASAKKTEGMQVDEAGIMQRVVSLPVRGEEYIYIVYAPEGKLYYGGRALSCFDFKTGKSTEMGSARLLAMTADGSKVLVRDGGKIGVCGLQGKLAVNEPTATDGMKVLVHYPAEWEQIFNETWRVYRDNFYCSNMHGVDWQAIRDKYAPLLPYVQHRHDLTYIIGEMIGELNVGHAYVTSGQVFPEVEKVTTGLLGARFQRDAATGHYKVVKILEAPLGDLELRSPLCEPGNSVSVGEYITAVNNVPCADFVDIYEGLIGQAGRMVQLTVSATASGKETRTVLVKPIADESGLCYYNWVLNNWRKVDKATNGEVGYLHIPDMSTEGLNMFTKMFYSQLDKKALIIDDRMNGGGNVSPIVLERLMRTPYRMTMYRNSEFEGTVPDAAFYGPKVLLVDKYSSSDGDLFPYGFRKLGLGKLVGTRTWGGIVGISGSLPYMDGQDVRTPFFTSYSMEGEWIIEGHGVDPDIVVDNNPYDEFHGIDAQLNKAIEMMKEAIKDYKPLPHKPVSPDKSK